MLGRKTNLWPLALFGIAFGYLEAAVVVYLRTIYYPTGFTFPLRPITPFVLSVEIGREAATLAMLVTVAALPGGRRRLWLARLLFTFGLWDIFYYVGLKLLLNWPASLCDWDILFLIPAPWAAPVWAPAAVATFFVIAGAAALLARGDVSFSRWHWLLGIAGAIAVTAAFLWNARTCIAGEVPVSFPWPLFAAGLASMAIPAAHALFRKTACRIQT